jgi:hypothetical protein
MLFASSTVVQAADFYTVVAVASNRTFITRSGNSFYVFKLEKLSDTIALWDALKGRARRLNRTSLYNTKTGEAVHVLIESSDSTLGFAVDIFLRLTAKADSIRVGTRRFAAHSAGLAEKVNQAIREI